MLHSPVLYPLPYLHVREYAQKVYCRHVCTPQEDPEERSQSLSSYTPRLSSADWDDDDLPPSLPAAEME